jgi:hypothetical protein
LSKYSQVGSCFEVFIVRNPMVRSEFNFDVWFVIDNFLVSINIACGWCYQFCFLLHACTPTWDLQRQFVVLWLKWHIRAPERGRVKDEPKGQVRKGEPSTGRRPCTACSCIGAGRFPFTSLFVWLVAGGWCWFVLREKYCWLVAGGWFVLIENYCWLVADKPRLSGNYWLGGLTAHEPLMVHALLCRCARGARRWAVWDGLQYNDVAYFKILGNKLLGNYCVMLWFWSK